MRKILFLLAFAVFITTALRAQTPRAFSADVTSTMILPDGTSSVHRGREYCTADKVRVDDDQTGSIIFRQDKNVMWVLMPNGVYIEQSGGNTPVNPLNLPRKVSIGSETIDGQMTDKYLATAQGVQIYFWLATGSGIPVRCESQSPQQGEMIAQFSNVQLGEPSPAVFEIPAGYQKMDIGGAGMMNGLMNGAR